MALLIPGQDRSAGQKRKKGFKKSIDIDEGRRRREETTLQIRKTKKDVRLANRGQMPVGAAAADTPASLAAASMLAAGGVAPGGYGELFYYVALNYHIGGWHFHVIC